MTFGIALFLWGAAAMAQETSPRMEAVYYGPIQLLLGLVISLVGAYAKGLERRVTKVEDGAAGTQRSLDRDYYTKSELAAQHSELKASLAALHRRLDYLRVPVAALHRQDDGA